MVTTATCGQSSAVSTRRTSLYGVWNGFLGFLMGNLDLGRQDDLIFNGSPATITEAPFMAYIDASFADGSSAACSASVVGEQWILTAAHCVVDKNNVSATRATAYVGNAQKKIGESHAADKIIPNAAFDKNNFLNGHDIALLHLGTPLTFTPSIQPICFPTTDAVLGKVISACDQKIYGWGNVDSAGTTRTDFLQKLDVTVSADVSSCTSLTDETIICVRGDVANSGACYGVPKDSDPPPQNMA
ncbi:unnamed protein product [Darwinula stevensoni]|uniref:Peptidase S1 domain-containing protein n=1 Tax=Darwinula stevensoni TaxID=69355 RepID=A0A7R8XII6_9CRUS|nr:unnamed protein product [Darwinula stevensoni]CAG0894353.1 unnamed protein product [Darwinula stevensoni]